MQGYDSTDEQTSDDRRRRSRRRDKTTSQKTTNCNRLPRRRSLPSHKKSNSQSTSPSQSTSRRTLKLPRHNIKRVSSIVTSSAVESAPFIFLDYTEQDHTQNAPGLQFPRHSRQALRASHCCSHCASCEGCCCAVGLYWQLEQPVFASLYLARRCRGRPGIDVSLSRS